MIPFEMKNLDFTDFHVNLVSATVGMVSIVGLLVLLFACTKHKEKTTSITPLPKEQIINSFEQLPKLSVPSIERSMQRKKSLALLKSNLDGYARIKTFEMGKHCCRAVNATVSSNIEEQLKALLSELLLFRRQRVWGQRTDSPNSLTTEQEQFRKLRIHLVKQAVTVCGPARDSFRDRPAL
ncbi:hypothetical protein M513_00946, partial [Trichuris suis]